MFKFVTELEHADASCCRPRSRWFTIQRSLVLALSFKVLLTTGKEVKSRSRHARRTTRYAAPLTICLPPFKFFLPTYGSLAC